MKHFSTAQHLSLLALNLLPCIASAQAGALDPNFGAAGVVTTVVGTGNAQLNRVLADPGGAIYAAGLYWNGTDADYALLKYHSDGSLDQSFGNMGMASTPIGASTDICYSSALQADGKVVLAGDYYSGVGYNFGLARFLPNGTLDATFGTNGIATVDMGATDNYGYAVAVRPNGKILVAGGHVGTTDEDFIVLQFNADGTLDTGFGTNGMVIQPVGPSVDHCWAMALQADGKVVLAGDVVNGTYWDLALVRFNVDGQLDASFGNGGIVITSVGDQDAYGYDMLVQADGNIVVGGEAHGPANFDYMIARFLPDGSLDGSFGTNGATLTDIGAVDVGKSVQRQPDGKYIVGGTISPQGFTVVRYNADGSLDGSFGTDGHTTTTVGTGLQTATSVAYDANNGIILAGYAPDMGNTGYVLIRYLSGLSNGITDHTAASVPFAVRPDPLAANTTVSYTLPSAAVVSFTLFDAEGRTVPMPWKPTARSAGAHNEVLRGMEALAVGRYTMVLSAGNSRSSVAVVKVE